MTLRRLLLASAGGLVALVAANEALARRAVTLPRPLPGTDRTYRWRGMDVAYTEAGDPGDRDVLFVHGVSAAATSREFDPVFGMLADDAHVIAPDLPGFGRSGRPPIAYEASHYVDFVGDFVSDVTDDPVVVASSLAGAYAVLAERERTCCSRLVLICPTATTMSMRRPALRGFLRAPVVGTAAFNALASKPAIRYFAADHGYYDPARVDAEYVDYRWRTAHQPGARFAPASFVSGHLDPDVNLADALADVDVPVTIVWGRDAALAPLSYGRDLAAAADARLVVFDNARLLPHVEYADRFGEVLADELRRAEG